MLVQIVGIAQALSFQTGETYSYLTLLLPTGKEVRATVADDVIAELTAVFMNSGSPAAQAATARVQASVDGAPSPPPSIQAQSEPEDGAFSQMERAQSEGLQKRSFSPVDFSDGGGGDDVVPFGGDYTGEDQAQLHAIEQQLAQAESKLASAIGDTTTASPAELRQVVSRITNSGPAMPVPNIMARSPLKTAPHVEADSFGNPVIKGAGLVDPRSLVGGNTEGEEDAGQI